MQTTGIVNLAGGALLLAIGVTCAGSSQATSRAPQAELVGAWKLNAELTERPGPGIEESTSPRRPAAVQPPGSGGRGPNSPVGYGGGRPDADETARMREAIRLATLIPERLTIVRDERGFVVTDASGVSHRLTPDGKMVKSKAGALTVETKAKWDDAVLVVERKFEGGVKATDRYWVAGTPPQLIVASKIEADRRAGPREFQRVYDAIR